MRDTRQFGHLKHCMVSKVWNARESFYFVVTAVHFSLVAMHHLRESKGPEFVFTFILLLSVLHSDICRAGFLHTSVSAVVTCVVRRQIAPKAAVCFFPCGHCLTGFRYIFKAYVAIV